LYCFADTSHWVARLVGDTGGVLPECAKLPELGALRAHQTLSNEILAQLDAENALCYGD
jgi:hypothetical protein